MDTNHETIYHKALYAFTAEMPCKTIEVNGTPYLRRYFVCEHADGSQEWLHQFLTADGERHIHSHPWAAVSTILCGGYTEEYEYTLRPGKKQITLRTGDKNVITADRLHRIIEVHGHCWTHMLVAAERSETWHFINEAGEREIMLTSPKHWWRHEKTRNGTEPTLRRIPTCLNMQAHINAAI